MVTRKYMYINAIICIYIVANGKDFIQSLSINAEFITAYIEEYVIFLSIK